MSYRSKFIFLFLFLLAFRTLFALTSPPVQPMVDELQTYLVGLKCYTTGTWPFFGPDVNGAENPGFNSQIPGALEGLLIGLAFHLLPIPETPFLLAAFLSTLGAALLAWYIQKRLPQLSLVFLFIWIAVTPWGLFEGAHVVNPAFIFLPCVLFFIGFMETLPAFSLRALAPFWSNALMGLSLLWVMQFHFSYVFFLPLAAYSIFVQVRKTKRADCLLHFAAGTLPMLALLLPTFLKYGLTRTNVASGFMIPFNGDNVLQGPVILARFLSLVSFELPRFLGITTSSRFGYLTSHPFLTVPGLLLWGAGLAQAVFLFICWFKKKHPSRGWKEMKLLTLLLFLLVWSSFWFTTKAPASHIYMCFYPWLMFYSCYCWSLFPAKPIGRLAAKVFVLMALYFQLGYALTQPPGSSLYEQRPAMAQALQGKNYRLLGERRPGSLY